MNRIDGSDYLPPFTDKDGIIWYPVVHALGDVVCSLTPESQKLWQDLANKQFRRLIESLTKACSPPKVTE